MLYLRRGTEKLKMSCWQAGVGGARLERITNGTIQSKENLLTLLLMGN